MNIKSLVALTMIGSLLPLFASASIPSQGVLDRVQENVAVLLESPDSQPHRSDLLADIGYVTQKHGIEGIAYLAYRHPFLLQTVIAADATGLENIAVSLLSLAQNEEEMHDMLVALIRAQVNNEMDPEAKPHLAILKKGISSSSVSLEKDRIDQLIAESITAGLELGNADVQAATFGTRHTELQFDIKSLLNRILIPLVDEIISQTHNKPV